MKKISKLVWIVIAFPLLISACVGSRRVAENDIENKTWLLTSYNGKTPIENRRATIQFIDGQVSGSTGCNQYGGGYQIEGDEIILKDLYSTEMACMEPEGIMEQEQAYLELLRAAARFKVVEGVLTFYAGANPILIFEIQRE